jgi:hypothetical protein
MDVGGVSPDLFEDAKSFVLWRGQFVRKRTHEVG